MILDHHNKFSENQAVTVSASSEKVVDQGSAGDAVDSLNLVVQCTEAVTAAGSATVTVEVQSSQDEAFSAPVKHVICDGIPKSSLVQGFELMKIKMPRGLKRYIRVFYNVANGPLTAGKFSAFLTPDVEVR